jgi:4-hydroxy-tetrahydrodipicolinate reductase
MDTIILGDGALGSAIATALGRRGDTVRLLGRPPNRGHDPAALAGADVVFDASVGEAVAGNVDAALAAGCRAFVIGTTGWDADRAAVARALHRAHASGVAAANLSLGAALFLRLVESATALFGPVGDFEPYVVEWHRRGKRDRPSGTARELARRIAAGHPRVQWTAGPAEPVSMSGHPADELEVVAIRAGSSPGSHLVGFDAPGETVELRLTARDRSAYAAGALAAADWLVRAPRAPGLHAFEPVVDELLMSPVLAATA